RKPVDFDPPQTAPVWLIDLGGSTDAASDPWGWLELRRPEIAEGESKVVVKANRSPSPNDLITTALLASRVNAFNKLLHGIAPEEWHNEVERRAQQDEIWRSELAPHAEPTFADASAMLRRLRQSLSLIQGGKKQRLRRSLLVLAVLFVVAV